MTRPTAGVPTAPAGVAIPVVEPVVAPTPDEAEGLAQLLARIDELVGAETYGVLRGPDGHEVKIPASALEALRLVAQAMAEGKAVTVAPHDMELTTQEAADLLRVSRPHLVKLLDRGDIAYHRTSGEAGAHRRLLLKDVMDYKEQRQQARQAHLRELTRLSEEAPGGYT